MNRIRIIMEQRKHGRWMAKWDGCPQIRFDEAMSVAELDRPARPAHLLLRGVTQ